ncbi:MAG: DEAD/DEAH box helicase, partial [Planctomycetota bacterium]
MRADTSMLVLHAVWTDGALHLWGETDAPTPEAGDDEHPRSAAPDELRSALGVEGDDATVTLMLPCVESDAGVAPALSPRLAHWLGHGDEETLRLHDFRVLALRVPIHRAERALDRAEELGEGRSDWSDDGAVDDGPERQVVCGPSVRYFATAARFGRALLAGQRVVPSVLQALEGPLRGAWEPWLSDESIAPRAARLLRSMPASARAPVDEHEHDPPTILRSFLDAQIDEACRRALIAQEMHDAIEGKPALDDPHVGWLHGLLDTERRVVAPADSVTDMVRSVRHWVGRLDDRGVSVDWRLLLRVDEPLIQGEETGFETPDDATKWTIAFCLQSLDNEELIIPADEIWSLRADSATVEGQRVDKPQELLLGELGRAARLFPALESALEEQTPIELQVPTREAYAFLREVAPLLREQNVEVIAPLWWDTPGARLGARLQLFDAPDVDASGSGASPSSAAEARLGLNALVGYEWSLAVGDTPISMEDFERLANESAPLVRINGRWVEVRKQDIQHAVDFIKENPGGSMRFGEALRMAYAYDAGETGMPIMGIDASGWVAALLGQDTTDRATFQMLEAPEGFVGELRPYQVKGLSWMAFLDRLGLGPCLADDMGLGKTIQLLALLQHEKNDAIAAGTGTAPTLLVVPMSIVGNWTREAHKFAPGLRVLVHHGVERKTGDAFVEAAGDSDIVITTYALAHRDHELLERVPWGRLVLDEAQNVKNASAKQSQAVRSLDAPRRIALTGTPLENRLSELWSIIDFCNPGVLGTSGEFRRTFGVPIE